MPFQLAGSDDDKSRKQEIHFLAVFKLPRIVGTALAKTLALG